MIRKALKWALLTGLVLCGGLYLHFSARAALDRDFAYTASAAALPEFQPDMADGLEQFHLVGRYSVEQQAQYMQGPYQEFELDTNHWLFRAQPRQTVAAVMQYIQDNSVHNPER